MPLDDPVDLIAGVPLVVIVPALVELAKRQGLPARYAGLAAIGLATALLVLAHVALGTPLSAAAVARWVLGGIVYGLAAAGLYSQRQALAPSREPPATAERFPL